jgi:hypothetical protein
MAVCDVPCKQAYKQPHSQQPKALTPPRRRACRPPHPSAHATPPGWPALAHASTSHEAGPVAIAAAAAVEPLCPAATATPQPSQDAPAGLPVGQETAAIQGEQASPGPALALPLGLDQDRLQLQPRLQALPMAAAAADARGRRSTMESQGSAASGGAAAEAAKTSVGGAPRRGAGAKGLVWCETPMLTPVDEVGGGEGLPAWECTPIRK